MAGARLTNQEEKRRRLGVWLIRLGILFMVGAAVVLAMAFRMQSQGALQ